MVAKMKEQGVLAEDAIDPFVPVCDPNVKGNQQAKGYAVLTPLVALMQP